MFDARSIVDDTNFQNLTSYKTDAEHFSRLLEEYVRGYTQKKRLADGLKEQLSRVQATESKSMTLSKGKQLDAAEEELLQKFSTYDLKEKISVLGTQTQAMIDEGKLTAQEKPQVLEHLNARLLEAKTAEKSKLVEKLTQMIDAVSWKITPAPLPLLNASEIESSLEALSVVEALEKRPWQSLTGSERDAVEKKTRIKLKVDDLQKLNQMWFETDEECKQRFQQTILAHQKLAEERRKFEEKQAAERIRLEKEEAAERKRVEDEQALERKRLAKLEKEEQKHIEMLRQIEERREEAKLKPVVEKLKKKERPTAQKIDNRELFEVEVVTQVDTDNNYWEENDASTAVEVTPAKVSAPVKAASVKKAPAKAKAASVKKVAKPVIESKWGDSALASDVLQEPDDNAGPSLAEAGPTEKAPKAKPERAPQPPPKKKEKKKFTKLGANDFFDATLFAEKEAAERLERERERERLAEEQRLEEERQEALWQEQLEKQQALVSSDVPSAGPSPASPAPVKVPVQKRKAAPPKKVIESKWTASLPAPEAPEGEDDLVVSAGPSLAEAVAEPVKEAPVKEKREKQPPPEPKKKGKKQNTKVDLAELGFAF
mmetsp:Transcript_42616/g.77834  ORF Transcript_42616/g.77834 Transcript_42616/m.77834 type:complete len:601 (-) Transcript_42616:197-1999(-)